MPDALSLLLDGARTDYKDASYFQAFISYLKSVYIQKNKEIFQVANLPVDKFAEALGLPGAPQIKFISQEQAKKKKNRVKVVELQGDERTEEVKSDEEVETVIVSDRIIFIGPFFQG